MQLAHEAALNGAGLSSVDSRVLCMGISTDTPKVTINTAAAYGMDGQRITGNRRDCLDVNVSFGLLCRKEEMQTRAELFEMVTSWALTAVDGAWLTIGNRPERRLWVRLQKMPAEGDPWQWTNTYTITFRANEVPWWQDVSQSLLRRENVTSGTYSMSVTGNVRTVMDFTYTNTGSAACDAITVSTGTSVFAFANLGCGVGEKLVIDHTEEGLLRIRIQATGGAYRSAMAKRTPASSDDLWIAPGVPQVTITAGVSGTCLLTCYGRFA